MSAVALLLAAVVLGWPVRSVSARVPARPAAAGSRLVPVAVAAVGAAAIALLGVVAGGLAAAALCPLARMALRRAARPRAPVTAADATVALVLDLAAAALRAGRPLAAALAAASPAAPEPVRAAVDRVAGLLRLGADPAAAWAGEADGVLAPVAVVAIRSATSGARLATSFERLGAELRAEAAAAAATRAQRAGVLAMGPLGACFLPSFVLLGVVPVVVGLAGAAFSAIA